jgi:hypothetical protein
VSLRIAFNSSKQPPVPLVSVDLLSLDGANAIAGVPALVDTGAARTVVPGAFLRQLKLQPVAQARAHGFGTASFVVDVYELRLVIPTVCDLVIRPIEHANEPQILLGREVLNQLRFVYDGPNQFIEFQ